MSGTTMNAGTSAQAAVGSSAQVVGNSSSSFYQAVMPAVFAAALIDVVQELKGTPTMMPGQSLGTTLGSSAEMYAAGGSQLGASMLKNMEEMGVVSTLLKLGSFNTYTPEQQKEAQVEADTKLAAIKLEDAQKQEAQAAEDRRQAFFAKPPSMG